MILGLVYLSTSASNGSQIHNRLYDGTWMSALLDALGKGIPSSPVFR